VEEEWGRGGQKGDPRLHSLTRTRFSIPFSETERERGARICFSVFSGEEGHADDKRRAFLPNRRADIRASPLLEDQPRGAYLTPVGVNSPGSGVSAS
jgi:hypothetical protein